VRSGGIAEKVRGAAAVAETIAGGKIVAIELILDADHLADLDLVLLDD
jgi:hypothetical protein